MREADRAQDKNMMRLENIEQLVDVAWVFSLACEAPAHEPDAGDAGDLREVEEGPHGAEAGSDFSSVRGVEGERGCGEGEREEEGEFEGGASAERPRAVHLQPESVRGR